MVVVAHSPANCILPKIMVCHADSSPFALECSYVAYVPETHIVSFVRATQVRRCVSDK